MSMTDNNGMLISEKMRRFCSKGLLLTGLVAMVLECTACGADNNNGAGASFSGSRRNANDPDDYIADWMDVDYDVETEFVVLRVKDDYLNISTNRESVYVDDVSYPEMEDGQFALIKGTVDIYNGGEDGYLGNYFIKNIESYEILDFAESIENADIASVTEKTFEGREFLLKYELPGELYLLASNHGFMEVYLNGEPVYEYDHKGMDVDTMVDPFWAELSNLSAFSFRDYEDYYEYEVDAVEDVDAADVFFNNSSDAENVFFKQIKVGYNNGRVPGPSDYKYVGVMKISDNMAEEIKAKYEFETEVVEFDRDIFEYVDGKTPEWMTSNEFVNDYLKNTYSGKLYFYGNEIYFDIMTY